jgi:hypothetical protein
MPMCALQVCVVECQHVSAGLVADFLGGSAETICIPIITNSTDHLHPEFQITIYNMFLECF